MRGRQFAAWIILAAFILMMCTACHGAENAVKDTTGEGQTLDAADVSMGTSGETEGEEMEPEGLVSDQTFMLSGDIPFTVSESALYTEEMILKAAEIVLEEFPDGVISLSYDEAENETLIREFERRAFPDWYKMPDHGVIVLSSLVKESVSARLYNEYFRSRYNEILSVDSSLKAAVASYLQAKFFEYNDEYTEETPGVIVSDQAKKEGDAWMAAFREDEKRFKNGFLRVVSEPVILYVTERDGNWLVSVNERMRIQYSKSDVMGSSESRLLVFRPREEGYELLHDYAREWHSNNEFEGIEEYLFDEGPVEKITLLTYNEEQKAWAYGWHSINREVSLEEIRGLVLAEMEKQSEKLVKKKADWFAAYNGEKLQITDKATYYRADQGESLGEIVKIMVDSWYADLPIVHEPYTITDYFLDDDQPIYSCGDVGELAANFAWSWWQSWKDIYDGSLSEFVSQVMYTDTEHTRPIADEDMWLLPYLDIYTKYEGTKFIPWESYVEYEGKFMKNGCMPELRQGSGSGFHYILVRDGDVYCLQRASDMDSFRWAHNGSFWGDGFWGY